MFGKRYCRRLYYDEKGWVALQQTGLPLFFHLIIEGTGDIPDKAMNNALKEVSLLYPICRSRLSGYLKNLRWEESDRYPSFIRMGSTTSPFGNWPVDEEKKVLKAELNLKKGPCLGGYSLYDGQRRRFYFKAHHSSMDGLSIHFIVKDLFRILRGEKPMGSTEGPDTKDELYKAILPDDFFEKRRQAALRNKDQKTNEIIEGGSSLFGGAYEGSHLISQPSKDKQMQVYTMLIPWDRISPSKLNAKMIVAIMETFKKRNPDLKNKRFLAWLPVDLRKFLPGLRNASNLTGIIPIELNKYLDIPLVDRVSLMQKCILEKVNDHSGVMDPAPIIDWLPVKLISAIAFFYWKITFYKRKFPYHFTLTNLGRNKLSEFSTKDFKAERILTIQGFPIKVPLVALLTTHDNGIELTCNTDTDKDPFAEFIDQLEEEIYSLEKQLSSRAASD